MSNGLLLSIPVTVCGALGAAAGYFFGEPGMYDEYIRNYGTAGAMGGMVVGAILIRRKQAKEKEAKK
jgi:hypothetical protein